MHIRATTTFSLWPSPLDPQRKEIKLFTRESSQQAKEEQEFFWGFLLNTTTSMESRLANFFVFIKVFQTHKKKARKRNKLTWMIQ